MWRQGEEGGELSSVTYVPDGYCGDGRSLRISWPAGCRDRSGARRGPTTDTSAAALRGSVASCRPSVEAVSEHIHAGQFARHTARRVPGERCCPQTLTYDAYRLKGRLSGHGGVDRYLQNSGVVARSDDGSGETIDYLEGA